MISGLGLIASQVTKAPFGFTDAIQRCDVGRRTTRAIDGPHCIAISQSQCILSALMLNCDAAMRCDCNRISQNVKALPLGFPDAICRCDLGRYR